jgi:hypothetical protein
MGQRIPEQSVSAKEQRRVRYLKTYGSEEPTIEASDAACAPHSGCRGTWMSISAAPSGLHLDLNDLKRAKYQRRNDASEKATYEGCRWSRGKTSRAPFEHEEFEGQLGAENAKGN